MTSGINKRKRTREFWVSVKSFLSFKIFSVDKTKLCYVSLQSILRRCKTILFISPLCSKNNM